MANAPAPAVRAERAGTGAASKESVGNAAPTRRLPSQCASTARYRCGCPVHTGMRTYLPGVQICSLSLRITLLNLRIRSLHLRICLLHLRICSPILRIAPLSLRARLLNLWIPPVVQMCALGATR